MKILHLEDNAKDAELVREMLTEAWADCQITVVAAKPDYTAELVRHYDLILSDFSLVGFNGIEALELARTQAPDTPFIFLSGNIGEDRAIEAVRAGAQDYVLKDRAKRLVTAIRRALDESAERRRVRAVELERERLVATLEESPDFIGQATPDGQALYINRAGRAMLELPVDADIQHHSIVEFHPPDVVAPDLRERFAIAAREGSWSGENILVSRGGRHIPVAQVIIAHPTATGSIEFFSTVMRNLTASKQNEALVHGQNQILEMIAGGEPLAETLTALLRFIEGQCDELICSILVLEEDGQHLRHCAAPRLQKAYTDAIDGLAIGPYAGSCGTAAFRREPVFVSDLAADPLWKDYRQFALPHGIRACWSTPIFDVQHHLLGTFAVYLTKPAEPTERHRQLIDVGVHIAAICIGREHAQRRLHNQADILNKAADSIIVTDRANRVTFWNQSAERTFGWSATEALGKRDDELFGVLAVAEIQAARKATEQTGEWRGEIQLENRQGARLIMQSRLTTIRDELDRPQGQLTIATDITEKKKIEEQFFRAQRLESLGMLAAGIAHDLNNVLAPILLAAPMLRDHATDPGDLRMIGTLEKSAERGAALVRQILSFAHGADGEHRLIQAKHVLRDVANFVEETFPKSINFSDHIPPDLWPIEANPTQLHQVLLNLCVNARDAMPEGGTLTLRSENRLLDEAAAAATEGARPGAYLVISVEDTGTGIPSEILSRIWDPFFTTKSSGKGTGLGLSTVRGIVESHNGFAAVLTIPGKGTTFRIHLPAAEARLPSAGPGPNVLPVPRGTGELVLVVDDEAGIRNMSAAMLARHGYRVLTAADGAEAIALFAPRSKEIRLVITDLSMPNLDGAALAGVVHRLNSAVKIVAVSGLVPRDENQPPVAQFSHAFLQKPFRPEALLTTVHELLRTPPNPPPPSA